RKLRDADHRRACPSGRVLGGGCHFPVPIQVPGMSIRKTASDRRAEIADAAMSLAADVGPGQVSTGMIAERLGLTQPAIYKHFSRKDDIWLAVADHLTELIARNIARAAVAPLSPDARLH